MSVEENKLLVRRLVEGAVRERNLDVLDELAAGEFAEVAKHWVCPFRSAFPDFEMEIVELIAEDDTVVGHFRCSRTHRGEWLGVPATGRRFERVDEIYIFRIKGWEARRGDRRRGQPGPTAPARHISPNQITTPVDPRGPAGHAASAVLQATRTGSTQPRAAPVIVTVADELGADLLVIGTATPTVPSALTARTRSWIQAHVA